MKPYEILKIYRNERNMSQEEVVKNLSISRSTYTRIESGETEVDIVSLISILNSMDADIQDFVDLLPINDTVIKQKNDLRNLLDSPSRDKITEMVNKVLASSSKTTFDINFLVTLYHYFHSQYPDIFPEIDYLKKKVKYHADKIIDSEYHTLSDYKFCVNSLIFLDEYMRELIVKALVTKKNMDIFKESKENVKFMVASLNNNFIDLLIKDNNISNVNTYIKSQEYILSFFPNQQFSTLLVFHSARIEYLIKPNSESIKKLHEIVSFYELIGYDHEAESLKRDIEELILFKHPRTVNIVSARG